MENDGSSDGQRADQKEGSQKAHSGQLRVEKWKMQIANCKEVASRIYVSRFTFYAAGAL
jgi:hypothetical protein